MKLLIDVNLSTDWVPYFASQQIEAVHWSSVGRSDAPDHEIATYALAHGYVVLTQDLDFGSLVVGAGADGPSVILIRAGRVTPLRFGPQLLACVALLQNEPEQPAFITLDPHRTRLRLLSFRPS